MLSTTATYNEYPWAATCDTGILSTEQIARKCSELIYSRLDKNALSDLPDNDALQIEVAEINRQCLSQEITHIIFRIGQLCEKEPGKKLISRFDRLREMLKEEQGQQADISLESLQAVYNFLQRLGRFSPPEISLTPEADIYMRWKKDATRLFAVHFQTDINVRFVVFSPNPRHPGRINRLSGMETVDTILETADNACSVLKWLDE